MASLARLPARLRLPLSRDQCFLLLAAFNQLFIALDIYLAHSLNGTIKASEWIPVVYGGLAGLALLLAGLIALRDRRLAVWLANIVFVIGIAVGLLGAYFHLRRTTLLDDGFFSLEAVSVLVWAPPVMGPLFFILISALGICAAWLEMPADSGRLRVMGGRWLPLPYSKTRAYMWITAMFIIATLISSVLDHARLDFDNAWVWLPVAAALFGMTTCLFLGCVSKPSAGDIVTHASAMLLLILVGMVGFVLHGGSSLTASGAIVAERFLRGSPLLAPLLFCNVGLMGWLALLDPRRDGIGGNASGNHRGHRGHREEREISHGAGQAG